mmetsp:Transcript_108051/g.306355  ORF Transcript_108051/g.306355 Transcript_108051/m.306355 type:complete len:242 (-) Transcript_108051:710-1435(-)
MLQRETLDALSGRPEEHYDRLHHARLHAARERIRGDPSDNVMRGGAQQHGGKLQERSVPPRDEHLAPNEGSQASGRPDESRLVGGTRRSIYLPLHDVVRHPQRHGVDGGHGEHGDVPSIEPLRAGLQPGLASVVELGRQQVRGGERGPEDSDLKHVHGIRLPQHVDHLDERGRVLRALMLVENDRDDQGDAVRVKVKRGPVDHRRKRRLPARELLPATQGAVQELGHGLGENQAPADTVDE